MGHCDFTLFFDTLRKDLHQVLGVHKDQSHPGVSPGNSFGDFVLAN